MNLSFAGCGFLGIYHVGVACCFRKYAPHLLLNKISGASVGAISACALLCDLPLGDVTSNTLRVVTEARSRSLGPFNPTFDIHTLLLEGMEKFLPENAHEIVNGKLHISLTRVCDGKNVIVSHFESREELIQALLASAFIPLFSGVIPPKFRDARYVDGGYSNNLPTLDENTITVSPFCGESDICPRDDSSQLFHINLANTSIEVSRHNIYRMIRILFPPKPEVLSNMCKQGFDDALRFLHRNNLINCTRCLAVQSTFVISENPVDENLEYDPQCKECKIHRQEALVSHMPETVLSIFQEAIDTANKGIFNWMFKNRGMKLLSVLTLPYTLPADMVYATLTKLVATAPTVTSGVWEASKYLCGRVGEVINNVNKKRQQLSAKIICQLLITEYDGSKYDVESCQDVSSKNEMNLNFTLDLDDRDLPLNQSPERKFKTQKILQKRPSAVLSRSDTGDEDTYEHILRVTMQHEAIMAYYYLDDNNKVKVTEIYDVTDSDSPIVQTSQEKETNQNLEFDNDWDESTWTSQQCVPENAGLSDRDRKSSMAGLSDYSGDDLLDKDASNLYSDPESEWMGTCKIEEPEEEDDDYSTINMPESDQTTSRYMKDYQIPSFTFQEEA